MSHGFGLTAFLAFRAAQHGAAPLLGAVTRLPGLRNGTTRVAITNLAGEPKRTGVMIMALAAAVGAGVVLGNINGSITAGSNEFVTHDVLYGETLPANNSLGIAAKPSEKMIAGIRAVPGVGDVTPLYGFCGEHTPTIGFFCVSTSWEQDAKLPVYRGRRTVQDVFAHGEVLIGTALARTEHLRPGDTFKLAGRSGIHTMKVGSIWGDPNNTGRFFFGHASIGMRDLIEKTYIPLFWGELNKAPAHIRDLVKRSHELHRSMEPKWRQQMDEWKGRIDSGDPGERGGKA